MMPMRAIWAGLGHRDVAAIEQDLARGGHQEFGQQVEAGGFAGAVRADQRVDMAALDFQVHIIDSGKTLEFLRQVPRFQYDICHCVSGLLFSYRFESFFFR
jgi:hypothetical protein